MVPACRKGGSEEPVEPTRVTVWQSLGASTLQIARGGMSKAEKRMGRKSRG